MRRPQRKRENSCQRNSSACKCERQGKPAANEPVRACADQPVIEELLDQTIDIFQRLSLLMACRTSLQMLGREAKFFRTESLAKIILNIGAEPLTINFHHFLFFCFKRRAHRPAYLRYTASRPLYLGFRTVPLHKASLSRFRA